MKRNAKILALILSVVLAMGCFAACGQSNGGNDSASANGVNLAMTMEPDNLDPSRCADTVTGQIVGEANEYLVRFDVNGVMQPAGAESWDISEDGLVYTFHLRANKYSDGTDVVAADYANAMLRNLDPEVGSHTASTYYIIEGAEAYNSGEGTREDVGCKALDDKTLQITLNKPVPYFIQMCLTPTLTPVPESVTQGADNVTYGADTSKMKFSGPFYVETWERGAKIVLKKNPNYWDADSVKLDTINCVLVMEENTRQQMFEQGEIDFLENVKQEYQDQMQADIESGKVSFVEMAQPGNSYICFNNQDPNGIFTNAKVRLAFSLAIDREEYISKVAKKGKAAFSFVPPATNNGEKKYRDMVEEPLLAVLDLDPKEVLMEGLKELGIKDPAEVTVTFLQGNSDNATKVASEYFQNQWQNKLGVNVKIETASDRATFNNTVSKGFYQICNTGWGADYNDPMTFMQMYTTGDGANAPFASNERYDELVFACMTEMDMNVRAEKFAEAEKIAVVDEAFLAPLSYGYAKNLVNGQLRDYSFNSSGGVPIELKTAYFETAEAEG